MFMLCLPSPPLPHVGSVRPGNIQGGIMNSKTTDRGETDVLLALVCEKGKRGT
jgi:hypothetical protein